MGSYNKGILGPFRGKVGTVIGYSWRGKDIMRGLPKETTIAATAAQLEQRAKFGTVIKFLTPIKEVVGTYFGKEQKTKSPFNLATSYHLTEALIPGLNDQWEMDLPKVLISQGELRGLDAPSLEETGENAIRLNWRDNSNQGNASVTDVLIAVVFCEELFEFSIFNPAATREELSTVLEMPGYMVGSTAHVWATFITENGKLAAVSSYAGSVVLR